MVIENITISFLVLYCLFDQFFVFCQQKINANDKKYNQNHHSLWNRYFSCETK